MKPLGTLWRAVTLRLKSMTGRLRSYLARRPHRSFLRTRRRDYVRSLSLPGYWAFTNHVRTVLWKNKRIFAWLAVVYSILTIMFVGMASQDAYTELNNTLQTTGGDIFATSWGRVSQAGLLLLGGIAGNFTVTPSAVQQVYAVILVLLVWLTSVWLLRAILAGNKPRMRDGLYNAGAPLIPTFFVSLLLVVQMLPGAIALIAYSAATASGLLSTGVEAMIFWAAAGLLMLLSLYLITSTLFALIIVTLPGMYPMKAIRTAGDLVIGRRLRILYRLLWLVGTVVVAWILVMIPIILLSSWIISVIPAIGWLPVVPLALLLMSTLTIVWVASYVYLFYRKVVDDDAAPA